jgi:aryl-alcohol dehydrogenase-like predicted oxidoreductase
MKQRNLGKSGLRVSLVGLGCNNFGGRLDLEATRRVVHRAIDAGITLFDTADVYGDLGGSETQLGQIFGDRRKDIVLASKFGMPMNKEGTLKGGSRRYMMRAVEDSLKRLRTDWIDLYQLHQPDPLTPLEETLRGLDDLVKQGKVRYIGCSNLAAWQVAVSQETSAHLNLNAFVSCQDEYSLVARGIEKELLPAARRFGLGLLPFFPLASGFLTGKYRPNESAPEGTRLGGNSPSAGRILNEGNFDMLVKLEKFAEDRGHSMIELAFSWLASNPVVGSVIAGATKPEQVEQNAKAADWRLTADEKAEVDTIMGVAPQGRR